MLTKQLRQILNIGVAFSKEKNRDKLLDEILTEAMDLTSCDAGTLYINNGKELEFKIMITRSNGTHQGGVGNDPVSMPPVELTEKSVCACAVLFRQLINIPDVYESEKYDFSGPKKYDAITGYRTKSMMVVPMEDDKENIIGVMQLINALDEDGNVVPFHEDFEQILTSMGSQAAICLVNMNYSKQIEEMLDSFVKTMSVAIDERTPYNANHTRNMVKYAGRFVDWLNRQDDTPESLRFSPEKKHLFLMSVWLHDIGKLLIPAEVMDKGDRLGSKKDALIFRIEKKKYLDEIAFLKGTIDEEEYNRRKEEILYTKETVEKINKSGFLTEEFSSFIQKAGDLSFVEDGVEQKVFTDEDITSLSIKRGTLTDEERKTMQSHVVMTRKLLEQMSMEGAYRQVVEWASAHHELLNGHGYPKGLEAEEIPQEVRILTIIDVYDALTAEDRPYKPPMPKEKAFAILDDMVYHGEVDAHLLELFKESKAWE
ncbi:MAG: GAF domain-containing protein [Lachnospiraceae bacterium]|nr:GAF domain-containing protein [Lachnospiraceae bacterium]